MKQDQFHQIPPGLYVVTWRSGAQGLAAIGERSDGGRWIACTHWFTIGERETKRAIEAIHQIDRVLIPQGVSPSGTQPERQERPQKQLGPGEWPHMPRR